jgi:hypothetical protein
VRGAVTLDTSSSSLFVAGLYWAVCSRNDRSPTSGKCCRKLDRVAWPAKWRGGVRLMKRWWLIENWLQ